MICLTGIAPLDRRFALPLLCCLTYLKVRRRTLNWQKLSLNPYPFIWSIPLALHNGYRYLNVPFRAHLSEVACFTDIVHWDKQVRRLFRLLKTGVRWMELIFLDVESASYVAIVEQILLACVWLKLLLYLQLLALFKRTRALLLSSRNSLPI